MRQMKVKTISAMTEKGLDKKITEFFHEISHGEIIDIKFSAGSVFAVFIMYNE